MPIKDIILNLAKEKLAEKHVKITSLMPSGSNRQYYRCQSQNKCILIAHNEDEEENQAFIAWAKFLHKNNIAVPKVEKTENQQLYINEDLGDVVLYDVLLELKKQENFSAIEDLLQRVLSQLISLQILDYSDVHFFHPVEKNTQSILEFDLNYLKYNFLKIIKQKFNEVELEKDFETLSSDIAQSKFIGLQYRDFQSRNIMLKDDKLYFIDFQTIRIGNILYDAVSLLYQSRLALPMDLIDKLKQHYKNLVSKHFSFSDEEFESEWNLQGYFRTLQNLGAYGFLGLIEHKKAFILPIKSSLSNLSYFSNNLQLKVPYLKKITEELKSNSILNHYINKRRMTIKIQSFSFKKGLPTDETEHGGGYIFDCRSIHNPGRYEEYKQKTGKDKEVQAFFESNTEMAEFLALVFELSSKHIDKYLNRNFDYLSIAFGCTGGQHRSVYSAEKLNTYLKLKYQDKIKIELSHREFPNL